MSTLSTLTDLPDVSYYDDWDSVKQALQNWAVKDKFTYRTPCKDGRRARYVCTQPGCGFRVTGNRDRSGRITVKVVNREHTCAQAEASTVTPQQNDVPIGLISPGIVSIAPVEADLDVQQGLEGQKDGKYRNPATQMKWLVTAMENVLDVTVDTKPADIQNAAKDNYNETISYQQAFRCLRILTADIKQQGHRERVPDDIRKAIVTLRVFVDPPMDWSEIERKTGIKARTAGYIFSAAEKKSGGSKDPFVLLRNATISASGPRPAAEKTPAKRSQPRPSPYGTFSDFPTSPTILQRTDLGDVIDMQNHSRKRRRTNPNVDPSLDLSEELAVAAATANQNTINTMGMLPFEATGLGGPPAITKHLSLPDQISTDLGGPFVTTKQMAGPSMLPRYDTR